MGRPRLFGLRGRLTIGFAVVALVPLLVAAIVTRSLISRRYHAEYARALDDAERSARRELAVLEQGVTRTVEALAVHDNPLLAGVLGELRRELAPSSLELDLLVRRAPAAMAAAAADLLVVSTPTGAVLAAPHSPRGAKVELPSLAALLARGRPALVMLAHAGGSARPLVVAARVVKDGAGAVTLAVGRLLDDTLLARLYREGGAQARLVAPDGVVRFATAGDWVGGTRFPERAVPVAGVDGAPAAFIEVAVPDDDLRRALHQLGFATLALALLGLVVSLLLGYAIARRMTRDLDTIAVAALAVSSGDLTHRVALSRSDEIGELAAAFDAMTEELAASRDRALSAERIAAWRDIAQSLAHEIKNPLTPIQMSAETLRKSWRAQHPDFPEILEESTRTVVEEVGRLKRIVGEFSSFARLPAPVRTQCDLDEIIASALVLYRGAVAVAHERAGPLPRIAADRDQLTQVVLNLVENARDAVAARSAEEPPGRIVVHTRPLPDGVELVVEDNGPGFDAAAADRLFVPYFTTKRTGTGLGLAIVHRIVTEHGGRIVAESEPGHGARFRVSLPAQPPAPATPAPASP